MAPLTELQQQEMLDTLFPDQKDEPELTPIPREVVSSEELDKLFPEETEEPVEELLEEPTKEEIPLFSRLLADPYGLAGADIEELKNISDEFAWAEGLGPQLMQINIFQHSCIAAVNGLLFCLFKFFNLYFKFQSRFVSG